MTLTIADVYAEHGLDLDEGDFAAELRRSLAEDSWTAPVSSQMLEDLVAHGGLRDPERLRTWGAGDDARLRAALHTTILADVTAGTMSATNAMRLLNVSASRLSHLTTDVPLVTTAIGGRRRYWRWQFVNGKVLNGLGAVVSALDEGIHPLDLATFMTSPAEELDGRSPVDFLASGGLARRVADQAAALTR